MGAIISAVRFVLFLFMLLLLARVVLGFVIALSREWRPKGAALVATETVFTVTDPPIKALRRVIPPLSFGQFRFDVAFLILFFGVSLLWQFLAIYDR